MNIGHPNRTRKTYWHMKKKTERVTRQTHPCHGPCLGIVEHKVLARGPKGHDMGGGIIKGQGTGTIVKLPCPVILARPHLNEMTFERNRPVEHCLNAMSITLLCRGQPIHAIDRAPGQRAQKRQCRKPAQHRSHSSPGAERESERA